LRASALKPLSLCLWCLAAPRLRPRRSVALRRWQPAARPCLSCLAVFRRGLFSRRCCVCFRGPPLRGRAVALRVMPAVPAVIPLPGFHPWPVWVFSFVSFSAVRPSLSWRSRPQGASRPSVAAAAALAASAAPCLRGLGCGCSLSVFFHFFGGFVMSSFFVPGSLPAAVCMFALSFAFLGLVLAVVGFGQRLAVAVTGFVAARRAIARLRRAALLPSGRSQAFIPPRLCRRAHWGLQFPLLWAIRGRWVRFQSGRSFRRLAASR
jgi:hypothetical protein